MTRKYATPEQSIVFDSKFDALQAALQKAIDAFNRYFHVKTCPDHEEGEVLIAKQAAQADLALLVTAFGEMPSDDDIINDPASQSVGEQLMAFLAALPGAQAGQPQKVGGATIQTFAINVKEFLARTQGQDDK